ncbi:MAG: hypothetical protein AB1499_07550 [Nitrospirota bacterium]
MSVSHVSLDLYGPAFSDTGKPVHMYPSFLFLIKKYTSKNNPEIAVNNGAGGPATRYSRSG